MSKYSAEELSLAGDQFLGRLYTEMDCQTFVENAMRQVGLNMDLKGSNAWFREVDDHGWTGSPEECKKIFGSVPKGALLFIHVFDGGEEKRGYHDGRGNAKHIGFKTGRSGADMVRRAKEAGAVNPDKWNYGDGAIHSSSTREHVATSKFADKTISGGGWNKVGLYDKFTYGDKIDRKLAEIRGGKAEPAMDDESEDTAMGYQARLEGGNAARGINVRKSPGGALLDTVPQGTEVTVTGESKDWCKIQFKLNSRTYTGYVKGEFVVVDDEQPADESGIPDEDFDADDGSEKITITLTATEAANALPVLDKLVDIIVRKVGRG